MEQALVQDIFPKRPITGGNQIKDVFQMFHLIAYFSSESPFTGGAEVSASTESSNLFVPPSPATQKFLKSHSLLFYTIPLHGDCKNWASTHPLKVQPQEAE